MTVRVGLIGTGYWARVIHGASLAQNPNVDFIGIWGRDGAKTAEAANELGTHAYVDVNALLEDVDALSFAVPPDVQVEIATRAVEQGRHVLLEKPIATSATDARRLERTVSDAGVASIVFFTRRFKSEVQAWLQTLEERGSWDCGRAEFAASIYVPGGPFASSPWRREKGALWDIGPHALSLLWPVLGEVTAVSACAGRGDQVHLVMRHGNGRSSTASLSSTVPQAAIGTTVYFYGESGREVAPADSSEPASLVVAHQKAVDALIELTRNPAAGYPCDVHFGARVVEVLAAAEEALAKGCTVSLA